VNRNLNPEALEELYEACLASTGAYEALKLADVDKHLPSYEKCLKQLNEAIEKAESND